MTKTKWEPLLQDSPQQLETIIRVLDKDELNKSASLLGDGNTGAALLQYYYGRHVGQEQYIEQANAIILGNFELTIPNTPGAYSLCSGVAGFRWSVNHLINQGFIEGDADELFEQDDALLYNVMKHDISQGRYDYLHNAIGIGLYFLQRRSASSIAYLASLIDGLAKSAITDQHGLKWLSMFNLQQGEGRKAVYNFSVSHGMTSIIGFLAKAYQTGIAQDRAAELLSAAVSYMLAHKRKSTDASGSYFPSVVSAADDRPEYGGRLAWCYGDLGLGYILWQVAKIMENNEWEQVAMDVLLQTTSRKDPNQAGVIDAGFCHGSSGIAHVYNRLYQHTGNSLFKDAALHWLDDTIRKAVFADGPAGYKAWHPPAYGGWKAETGILQGISGIGLVLLAAASDMEPRWDECLLLS